MSEIGARHDEVIGALGIQFRRERNRMIKEVISAIDRHFGVLMEEMKSQMKAVVEGQTGRIDTLEKRTEIVERTVAILSKRRTRSSS